jgi:hypothetical protein
VVRAVGGSRTVRRCCVLSCCGHLVAVRSSVMSSNRTTHPRHYRIFRAESSYKILVQSVVVLFCRSTVLHLLVQVLYKIGGPIKSKQSNVSRVRFDSSLKIIRRDLESGSRSTCSGRMHSSSIAEAHADRAKTKIFLCDCCCTVPVRLKQILLERDSLLFCSHQTTKQRPYKSSSSSSSSLSIFYRY